MICFRDLTKGMDNTRWITRWIYEGQLALARFEEDLIGVNELDDTNRTIGSVGSDLGPESPNDSDILKTLRVQLHNLQAQISAATGINRTF